MLSTAVKPVLLGGPRLRAWKRADAFIQLADALGWAVAVTADAKGMFPENHPNFIGVWLAYVWNCPTCFFAALCTLYVLYITFIWL